MKIILLLLLVIRVLPMSLGSSLGEAAPGYILASFLGESRFMNSATYMTSNFSNAETSTFRFLSTFPNGELFLTKIESSIDALSENIPLVGISKVTATRHMVISPGSRLKIFEFLRDLSRPDHTSWAVLGDGKYVIVSCAGTPGVGYSPADPNLRKRFEKIDSLISSLENNVSEAEIMKSIDEWQF